MRHESLSRIHCPTLNREHLKCPLNWNSTFKRMVCVYSMFTPFICNITNLLYVYACVHTTARINNFTFESYGFIVHTSSMWYVFGQHQNEMLQANKQPRVERSAKNDYNSSGNDKDDDDEGCQFSSKPMCGRRCEYHSVAFDIAKHAHSLFHSFVLWFVSLNR